MSRSRRRPINFVLTWICKLYLEAQPTHFSSIFGRKTSTTIIRFENLEFNSVYCPFPGSVANRKLFILFCREHCGESEGGWKIIRQTEPEVDLSAALKVKDIGTTDWNNDDDDEWGDEDDDWGVSEKVQDMKISEQKKDEFETILETEQKSFYINVVEDYKEDLSYEE